LKIPISEDLLKKTHTVSWHSFLLDKIGKNNYWGFARLFSECIDKDYFNPTITSQTPDEQAFEQVVSRYEQYLQITEPS